MKRWTRSHSCVVCGGWDSIARGPERCWGGLSEDQRVAYCTTTPNGSKKTYRDTNAYTHWLVGQCNCGVDHGEEPAAPKSSQGAAYTVPEMLNWSKADRYYEYVDSSEKYLFSVVRWDAPTGKTIRQGRVREDGSWVKSLREAGVEKPYPLYNLAEIQHLAHGAYVYYVEGEKAADELFWNGLPGFTSMGGAGNAHNSDWSPVEGLHVLVLPDNDEIGRRHAAQVSELCLSAGAASVRVVELPELPEKGDVVDWFAVGHKPKDLLMCALGSEPKPRLAVLDEYEREEDEEVDEFVWEEPIPLGAWTNLEPFPVETLPRWGRNLVVEVARESQTPVEAGALVYLALLSTALGGKVTVWPWAGRKDEPVTLYVMVAMPPGTGKSIIFRYLTAPVYAWEEREAERLGTASLEAQAKLEALEANLKHAKEVAAKKMPGDSDRQKAFETVAAIQAELANVDIPQAPQKIADETTPEALVKLFKANKGRMALLSDEGDLLDIIAGRYSGEPRLGPYKKGYDGGQIRVNRVGRTEFVKRPALTIGVTPQPDVLRGLGKVKRLSGEGLLDRFTFSLPEDLRGHRDKNQAPVSEEIMTEYEKHITALLDVVPEEDEDGEPCSVIRFSPEAAQLFVRFENNLVEAGMLNPELYGNIPGWASKFPGRVARIAALLHCAELIGTHTRPWEVPISVRTIKKAMAIGKYIICHAKAAFQLMQQDEVMEDAEKAINWLRDHAATTGERLVSGRSVWHPHRGKFKKESEFDKVMEVLVGNGYLRPLDQDEINAWYKRSGGRGRKPASGFEINPLWLAKTLFKASKKQADWDSFIDWDADGVDDAPAPQGEDSEGELIEW
jgi:hypothetical protein